MKIEQILIQCDGILEKDCEHADIFEKELRELLKKHNFNPNIDVSWET